MKWYEENNDNERIRKWRMMKNNERKWNEMISTKWKLIM